MNDKIRNKLLDYEAEPPADAWSAIVTGLDNQTPLTLPQKLQQYEEPPPAVVWDHIADHLDKAPVVIPFYQRFASFIRYGAAAIVVLIGTFVIFLYHHQKTLPKAAVQNAIHVPHTAAPKENVHFSKTEATSGEISDRYMLVPTHQGKTVKVSKKLAGWMDCLYGTDASPCNETLRQWQAKMAAAPLAPATDFMGTLDMLNTLNKNR